MFTVQSFQRFILFSSLASMMVLHPAMAQNATTTNTPLALTNMQRLVDVSIQSLPIGQALEALSSQGGFNLVLGEGLDQPVTVSLHNVPLQDVLLAIKQMGGLYYLAEGNTLYVSLASTVGGTNIHRREGHVLQVRYLPATLVASLLNQTLFAPMANPAESSTTATPLAIADPVSNSVVLNVDTTEAHQAAAFVKQLDVPRIRRTWHLNFQNALDVAEALAASVFHNGSAPLIMPSGGGSAGGGGASTGSQGSATESEGDASQPTTPSSAGKPVTVERESVSEGTGSNSLMGSGDNATGGKALLYRQRGKTTEQLSLGSKGPILLPDTRSNTLTLMGTAQQIQQAEAFIGEYDRQRQQVYLELSIVELSDSLTRILTPSIQAQLGKSGINLDFNGSLNNLTTVGYVRPIQSTGNFNAVLNFLQQEGKLQVLAKPSVLATHAEEAHISVMDEVIQGFSEVSDQNNNIVARVANITGAGISLNILPYVGANGDVSLRVNPVISFPQANAVNNIQLISLREMIAQNIILKDGQSFILGGLKQHLENKTRNTLPGLGNIPILGSVFNTLDGRNKTSELLIMITPHIIQPKASMTNPTVLSEPPSKQANLTGSHSQTTYGFQAPNINYQGLFPQVQPLKTTPATSKGKLPPRF